MPQPSELSGWVYILEHQNYPGLVKIGFTSRTIVQRIKELESATGAIPGYKCFYRVLCMDPESLEAKVHRSLSDCREWKNKEFFRIGKREAVNAVNLQIKFNDVEALKIIDEEKINDKIAAKAEADKIESERIYREKIERLEIEKRQQREEKNRRQMKFDRLPAEEKLAKISTEIMYETDRKIEKHKQLNPRSEGNLTQIGTLIGFLCSFVYEVNRPISLDANILGPMVVFTGVGAIVGLLLDYLILLHHRSIWKKGLKKITSEHNDTLKPLAGSVGLNSVPRRFLR